MSSKKKKGEGKGESWEKGEEIFQGVILTDSFNFRFLPVTLETPRVSGFIYLKSCASFPSFDLFAFNFGSFSTEMFALFTFSLSIAAENTERLKCSVKT